MIELGNVAKKEHYRVGKTLALSCDYIFLTKKNFFEDVQKGVQDAKGSCHVEVAAPAKIANFVNNQANKSDVVVFEGKEAAVAMNKIL
jgi:UDP-N-acetylmuramyl pentapeptide synthase